MFLSVLHLAVSTNQQGYLSALWKTWSDCGLNPINAPAKSSLCEARKKVSFQFFKKLFDELIKNIEPDRVHYKGLKVYAIDGDQYSLPASKDILTAGYRGFTLPHSLGETHYPRMYLSHAYDVMTGVTKAISFSPINQESNLAFNMACDFEQKSLTLYDRFYMSKKLILSHALSGSFFLVRLKKGGGGNFKAIDELTTSNRRCGYFEAEGTLIRLIKIKNPRTKMDALFATNLAKNEFSDQEIALLYARRWEVETSFRDLTSTLKLEQWHSKSANGILQELFALFWFYNATKIVLVNSRGNLLHSQDTRANFKTAAEFVSQNLRLLIFGYQRKFHQLLRALIKKSLEKRIRFSRLYPRQVKQAQQTYIKASTVPKRPKPPAYFQYKKDYLDERRVIRAIRISQILNADGA